MNNKKYQLHGRRKGLLLGLLITATTSAQAQTELWDTFIPLPDMDQTYGRGVLIDPFSPDPNNPGLFVTYNSTFWGAENPYGRGSILRLDPVDSSAYSTTVLDAAIESPKVIGYDHRTLSVYVAGSKPEITAPPFPRVNYEVWTVRKSQYDVTAGAWGLWKTVDSYKLSKAHTVATGFAAETSDASANPVQNLYVSGYAGDYWVIRKSTGGAWQTVFTLKGGRATKMRFFPGDPARSLPAAVFSLGVVNGRWEVRRSQDQGATWQLVDSWVPSSKESARPTGIAYDNLGALYVVGHVGWQSSPRGWVIRKNQKGGDSGSWVESFRAAEGRASWAGNVALDGFGYLWVSGMTFNDALGRPMWTVLKHDPNSPNTQDWSSTWSMRQIPFGSTWSKAYGIATDSQGHVFVTGEVENLLPELPGFRIPVQRLVR